MLQTFSLGSRVRFSETFTDLTVIPNAPTDPTTVTLKLHDPTGTETSFTYAAAQIVKDAVGVYHFDFTFTIAGRWLVRWVATGSLVATDERQIDVTPSGFLTP